MMGGRKMATIIREIYKLFMKQVKTWKRGETTMKEELQMPMHSMSTIAEYNAEEDLTDGSSIKCDTEAHIRQIENIFNLYLVDIHKWSVFQIGDRCPLNKSIAAAIEIPHVGCCNHKLNLESNCMIDKNTAISTMIDDITTTMRECKPSTKNRAMLQRLTKLTPFL